MKQLIVIDPLSPERVKLTLNIGEGGATIINLRRHMVPSFINRHIIGLVRRYVSHRLQLLLHFGAHATVKKLRALDRLKMKLNMSKQWTTLATARHIRAMRDDLLTIMPGKKSRYFDSNYTLLTDLFFWADTTIQQHQQHYAQSTKH
jgi:hypothetical protein